MRLPSCAGRSTATDACALAAVGFRVDIAEQSGSRAEQSRATESDSCKRARPSLRSSPRTMGAALLCSPIVRCKQKL